MVIMRPKKATKLAKRTLKGSTDTSALMPKDGIHGTENVELAKAPE